MALSRKWAPQPQLGDLCVGRGQSPAENRHSESTKLPLGIFSDQTHQLWAARQSSGPLAPSTPAPAREPRLAARTCPGAPPGHPHLPGSPELWSDVLASLH